MVCEDAHVAGFGGYVYLDPGGVSRFLSVRMVFLHKFVSFPSRFGWGKGVDVHIGGFVEGLNRKDVLTQKTVMCLRKVKQAW